MTAQASQLPDPQTAYNTLFNDIHQRIFFQKLAAAGHQPRTPQEAQWMLETAGKLRVLSQAGAVKSAQAESSPYFAANQALDTLMNQYGLATPTKQAAMYEEEAAIQHLTSQLVNDPVYYNSILSLKTAEACDIRASLTGQA